MKRFGLVAIKLGCSSYFNELDGLSSAVTVLKIPHCVISAVRTKNTDGYNGIQIAYDEEVVRKNLISKPILGNINKLNLPMLRYFKEFVFDSTKCNIGNLEIGRRLSASVFSGMRKLDITGFTKGRGFSGVMKRHGFSGLEASHGVSVSHRSHGSIGQRTDPGKVFKNKKMAGRYGASQKTIQGLSIVHIDEENNIIVVKGAVPGAKNSFIFVREVAKFN